MAKPTNRSEAARVIARRREKILTRRGYRNLILKLLALGLVLWVLFTRVFLFFQVSGNGMFPSVKDGDLAFAYCLQEDYAKDDLVIYLLDGQKQIGRLAAFEGDVVTLDDTGTLLVNGTVQSGEIQYPTYAKDALSYPYTVPDGCVFILGDYRTQTLDSRDFGPVLESDVLGKVITVLRRRGL